MNAEITNVRLFDLVRFMRSELHQAELITDEEYVWLCSDAPLATCKEGVSPRRRLEDYDYLRKQLTDMRDALRNMVVTADNLTDGQINPESGLAEREFIEAREAARSILIAKARGRA